MNKREIIKYLKDDSAEALFAEADKVKTRIFGNKIILRAIIEFSNFCRGSCQYCGMNADNKALERYRFSPEQIESYAREAYEAGYRSIILQSGEDPYYDADKISEIIGRIKSVGEVLVTLSIGERSREEYRQWKEAGADRFLLKHETADETLYNSLHSHSTFRNRIACLYMLKELGYKVGSGFMVGLPGQSLSSVADDLLLLKELEVDMAGIGIYIPHPQTPAFHSKDRIENAPEIAVRSIAIARLLLPKAHLPATTSLEIGRESPYTSLHAGANVIMKKAEPYYYRKLYEIYPNPQIVDSSVKEERDKLVEFLTSQGFTIETGVC